MSPAAPLSSGFQVGLNCNAWSEQRPSTEQGMFFLFYLSGGSPASISGGIKIAACLSRCRAVPRAACIQSASRNEKGGGHQGQEKSADQVRPAEPVLFIGAEGSVEAAAFHGLGDFRGHLAGPQEDCPQDTACRLHPGPVVATAAGGHRAQGQGLVHGLAQPAHQDQKADGHVQGQDQDLRKVKGAERGGDLLPGQVDAHQGQEEQAGQHLQRDGQHGPGVTQKDARQQDQDGKPKGREDALQHPDQTAAGQKGQAQQACRQDACGEDRVARQDQAR